MKKRRRGVYVWGRVRPGVGPALRAPAAQGRQLRPAHRDRSARLLRRAAARAGPLPLQGVQRAGQRAGNQPHRPAVRRARPSPRWRWASPVAAGGLWGVGGRRARPRRSQWSVFEDHDALVRDGEASARADARRAARPRRRHAARRRSSGTRSRRSRWRASGRASTRPTPTTIPASGPTTTSCGAPTDKGFRVVAYLAPDAPRWATAGRRARHQRDRQHAAGPRGVRRLRGGGRAAATPARSSGSRSGTSPTTCCS